MNRSHGTKSHMMVSKFRSGTKADPGGLVQVALFWKSHCATCSPACVILYRVTGSCKGPSESFIAQMFARLASACFRQFVGSLSTTATALFLNIENRTSYILVLFKPI